MESNQLIYSHFSDDQHRAVPLHKLLKFEIIEKVKAQNPALLRKKLNERERYCFKKLKTEKPFGLNDMPGKKPSKS